MYIYTYIHMCIYPFEPELTSDATGLSGARCVACSPALRRRRRLAD